MSLFSRFRGEKWWRGIRGGRGFIARKQRRGKSKEEIDFPDGEPAGKGIDEEEYLQ
jgi:hypothetical protein